MIQFISKCASVIASVVLLLMMFVSVIDVAGRNLFGAPLPGGSEWIEFAMVVTVFLLYPRVAYKGLHISIDLFDGLTSEIVKRVQSFLADVLGVAVFAAIAVRLWILGDRAATYGDVSAVLMVPLSYVFWFMAALSAVTAIAFLARVPRAFRRGHFSFTSASQERA